MNKEFRQFAALVLVGVSLIFLLAINVKTVEMGSSGGYFEWRHDGLTSQYRLSLSEEDKQPIIEEIDYRGQPQVEQENNYFWHVYAEEKPLPFSIARHSGDLEVVLLSFTDSLKRADSTGQISR